MELAGQVGVGRMIWQAMQDTHRLVRSNTNLGMVLLLVPLAKACFFSLLNHGSQDIGPFQTLMVRRGLAHVLANLTVEDARLAYAAIRLARPGGLVKPCRQMWLKSLP
jgi:triphosphoribosyl-dephospho-CoA synthase